MTVKDVILLLAYLSIGVMGAYVMTAPRRLFTRPEDPPRYRPGAVEYDSDQGRRARRIVGPAFILLSAVLVARHLLSN